MNKGISMLAGLGLAGTFGVGMAAPAEARQRQARCVIEAPQTSPYRGPCRFAAERNGSFTIDPPRGRRFVGDVTNISVSITGRGAAEVRGMTTSGVNSRWGSASRSPRDPACWIGSDFRVCAY